MKTWLGSGWKWKVAWWCGGNEELVYSPNSCAVSSSNHLSCPEKWHEKRHFGIIGEMNGIAGYDRDVSRLLSWLGRCSYLVSIIREAAQSSASEAGGHLAAQHRQWPSRRPTLGVNPYSSDRSEVGENSFNARLLSSAYKHTTLCQHLNQVKSLE